jgi:hypothetical protein
MKNSNKINQFWIKCIKQKKESSMQSFKLEVKDSISDKILWLLSNFGSDVKIKKIDANEDEKLDEIKISMRTALQEVSESKKDNSKLKNAWDVLDEL